MKSRSTIEREIRELIRLWKSGVSNDHYHMLRGAEFALAWALEEKVGESGCKVSALVKAAPEMDKAILLALERTDLD